MTFIQSSKKMLRSARRGRSVSVWALISEIAHTRSSLYLDLESPFDRVKLTDPEGYLADHEDTLVILDEDRRPLKNH